MKTVPARAEMRRIEYGEEARALVDAYCQRYGITGYVPNGTGVWLGVYENDELTGVGAYVDHPNVRFIQDWYVVEGRAGLRASSLLWREFRSRGAVLSATVSARNTAMLGFLDKYPIYIRAYILQLAPDASPSRRGQRHGEHHGRSR